MSAVSTKGIPALLTSAEVAEILKVTIATLSDWRNNRKGPAFIRAGSNMRQIRYSIDDVQAWLDQQRVPCSSSPDGE